MIFLHEAPSYNRRIEHDLENSRLIINILHNYKTLLMLHHKVIVITGAKISHAFSFLRCSDVVSKSAWKFYLDEWNKKYTDQAELNVLAAHWNLFF